MSFLGTNALSELVSGSQRRLKERLRNKSLKRAKEQLKAYYMRPDVLADYLKRLKKDEDFREALFNNENSVFRKAMEHVDNKPDNFQIAIFGGNGSGKTEFEKALASHISDHYDTKIGVAFRDQEWNELLSEMESDSVACYDEPKKAHGEGSKIQEDNIENVRNEVRFHRLHIIVVRTNIQHFKVWTAANWRLLPCGYDEETGIMRAITHDSNWKPRGYITINRCVEPETNKYFLDEKMKDYLRNRERKGYDWRHIDVKEDDILTVIDFLDKNQYPKLSLTEIQAKCKKINRNWNPDYIKALASDVSAERKRLIYLFKEEKLNVQATSEINCGDYILKSELESRNKDEEFIIPYLKHVEIKAKGLRLNPNRFKVFRRKCYHEGNLEVSVAENCATGSVHNWQMEILQKCSGYAGEEAYKEYLQKLGVKFHYVGGNTHEPDYIVDDWEEVISFKCYLKFRIHKAVKHIAKSEIEAALRLGYKLILLAYDILNREFLKYVIIIHKKSAHIDEHPDLSGVGSGSSKQSQLRDPPKPSQSKRRKSKPSKQSKGKSRNSPKNLTKGGGVHRDVLSVLNDRLFKYACELQEKPIAERIVENMEGRNRLILARFMEDFSHEERTRVLIAISTGQTKSFKFLHSAVLASRTDNPKLAAESKPKKSKKRRRA